MAKKAVKKTREFFSDIGRKGGSTTGKSKARDPEKMREAQKQRWAKHNQKKAEEQAGEQSDAKD